MRIITLLAIAALLAGCGSRSYRPVQEIDFDRLVDQGCQRSGDRFSVTARINSASQETVVLWDGRVGARTIAVRLPPPGFGSKVRNAFGKNRYEVALEQLNRARIDATPVNFTMRCEGARQAPIADRFSYFERGQMIQFEF